MSLTKSEAAQISLAGNPVIFGFTTDSPDESNMGIHIQVQEYDGSEWADVGPELRYEPDASGDVEVDVSDIINWEPDNLTDDKLFNYPAISGDVIAEAPHLVKTYRVIATEKYGNPLTEGDSITSSTRYAIPAVNLLWLPCHWHLDCQMLYRPMPVVFNWTRFLLMRVLVL